MTMRVGLIGCGNISDVYLANAPLFKHVRFVAVSSRSMGSARRRGKEYGLAVRSVEELISSDDVDVVLNLTTPNVHAEISLAAIEGGKHVYSEKPLATNLGNALELANLARSRGLRVGCAPDTVLGSGIQTARAAIDAGMIGRPLVGIAAVLSHGMEDWHPNPGFFYQQGGGPLFDLGPYYISALVTLLGPIARVSAVKQKGFANRIVTARCSPLFGQEIPVEVPTSIQALLEFASGAQVTFMASFDVWRHSLPPIEIHGTTGSIRVSDPDNTFGGVISVASERSEWIETDTSNNTFGRKNWPTGSPTTANYRGVGLAEMAYAIGKGRPHRASVELAIHTLSVMSAITEAADQKTSIDVALPCQRPDALDEDSARSLIKEDAKDVKPCPPDVDSR